MEEEKLDKLAREGPPKPCETPADDAKPSGADSSNELKLLVPCALLGAVGIDVAGEHNMPLFTVVTSAYLGALFGLPSKHTITVVALSALAYAGACGYAFKCWDLKKKTKEAEE